MTIKILELCESAQKKTPSCKLNQEFYLYFKNQNTACISLNSNILLAKSNGSNMFRLIKAKCSNKSINIGQVTWGNVSIT